MADTFGYDYEPKDGGLFLKLKDGDKVQLRLASKPLQYTRTYEDGTSSERFAWIVLHRASATVNEVKVFEQGPMVYKQVKELALNPDWGDPTQYDLRVSRTGAGQTDTRYMVQPSPNKRPLTKDEVSLVEQANIDLQAIIGAGNQPKTPSSFVDSEITEQDINEIDIN